MVLSADDKCNIAEVQHDGGEPWSILNGEYRLSSFPGRLSITLEDGERSELTLFNGAPMVFKLRSDWRGDGRKVHTITSGFYVVIVPKEWKRTGPVPREPEGCADQGFLAHFFRIEGKSMGDVGGFEKHEFALVQSSLELTGDRVFDDSKDGELFVGAAPKLNPAPGVAWARVGEEKEGGWRGENFKPAEQTLADVLNGRQGRFFIRVYNDGKLLDSGEFRYLRDLQEIRVSGKPYSAKTLLVPSSTGHSPTELQFICADGATIFPTLVTDETHATVQGDGAIIVERHPQGDRNVYEIGSDAGSVDVSISLPRIWWWLERDHGESEEWCDTPFSMTRQEFRQYANTNYAIRLRLPPCVASVKVGFDEELDRAYRPKQKGNEAEIHLAEFADYRQIDQRLNEDAFLNVQCDEEVLTLIRISADPVPTIISFTSKPASVAAGQTATLHWDARNVESNGIDICPEIGLVGSSGSRSVTPAETTTYTLRLTASGLDDVTRSVIVTVPTPPQQDMPSEHCPLEKRLFARVKRPSGGWRSGKGFSHTELKGASLTLANAKHLRIPIDRRRRSTHPINVDMIKELINA